MTHGSSSSSDDILPAGRVVRWLVLGGVILFAVGLYFRFGRALPPIGAVPPSQTATP